MSGRELSRQEPVGTIVPHAGLSGNEIIVDGRDIYVNGADFDLAGSFAGRLTVHP